MREIIRQLASQGYLTTQSNRGAIVTKLSLEDIDVIYSILIRCESYGAALFANRRDMVTIQRLEQIHKEMQTKDAKTKYSNWLHLNDRFHETIYSNCGSSILANFIHNARLRIYRFRALRTSSPKVHLFNREHARILAALRKGDGALADSLMTAHLEGAKKRRLEMFAEFPELL